MFDAGRVFRLTARVLILLAVLLGVIEGLTEFLPISSTGHLVIFDRWFGFNEAMGAKRAAAFEVFIQFGAILAVVVYFRKRLLAAAGNAMRGDGEAGRKGRRFFAGIAVAVMPAMAVGYFAHGFVEENFLNPTFVAWALIGGGVVLWGVDRWRPKMTQDDAENLTWLTIVVVGCAQTLAILLPGVSRAGATICAALLLGVSNRAAAEFSFFMAIPTMFAASSYSLWKHRGDLVADDWGIFAVGFVCAFVSALVVVKAFITFLQRHSFAVFAYYRVAFGAVILAVGRFF